LDRSDPWFLSYGQIQSNFEIDEVWKEKNERGGKGNEKDRRAVGMSLYACVM